MDQRGVLKPPKDSGSLTILALRLSRRSCLIDSFATTLNQNDQQNDSDNAANDPDNRCIVHVNSPFLLI